MKDFDGYFAENHPDFIEEGRPGTYKFNSNRNMNTNRLSWTNIKSAITMGVTVGALALIAFFMHAGSFFGVDYHAMINVFGLATLGAIGSIVQSLLTVPATGNYAGAVKIK